MFKSSIINNKTRSKERKQKSLFGSQNKISRSSKNLKHIITPFRFSKTRNIEVKDLSNINQNIKPYTKETRKYRSKNYGKFSLFSNNTSQSFTKRNAGTGKKHSFNASGKRWMNRQRKDKTYFL